MSSVQRRTAISGLAVVAVFATFAVVWSGVGRGEAEAPTAAPTTAVPPEVIGETGVYRIPFASLEELASSSEVIVVATPVRTAGERWLSLGGREEFVSTYYLLRVDRVVKGAVQSGQVIQVAIPGGTFADRPFPATGPVSLKPKVGERTRVRVFADYPPFEPGRQELLFLGPLPREADLTYGLAPEGRYLIATDGTLTSTLRTLQKAAVPESLPARAEIEGRTLDDAVATIGR